MSISISGRSSEQSNEEKGGDTASSSLDHKECGSGVGSDLDHETPLRTANIAAAIQNSSVLFGKLTDKFFKTIHSRLFFPAKN